MIYSFKQSLIDLFIRSTKVQYLFCPRRRTAVDQSFGAVTSSGWKVTPPDDPKAVFGRSPPPAAAAVSPVDATAVADDVVVLMMAVPRRPR